MNASYDATLIMVNAASVRFATSQGQVTVSGVIAERWQKLPVGTRVTLSLSLPQPKQKRDE